MSLYPISLLDADQIIQNVFDEPTQTLRTSGTAVITPPPGGLEVAINHIDDSIAIGTDTDLFTSTSIGPDIGLDVHIINTSPIPVTFGSVGTTVNTFGEVTSVGSSVLTTISTYTVPALTTAKLQKITFAGTNIAMYEILIDGFVIERYYTYFSGPISDFIDFGETSLTAGQIVLIRVLHVRPDVGDFNARIQVLET